MVEEKPKIGRRGEIFTTKKIREALGLYPDAYVLAIVTNDKLVIRKIPSLDELLNKPYAEVDWMEVEKLSEEMQKRLTVYEEENSV